ncbi:MAG: hypothetical protein CVU44_01235 [Chloroflexi bacterium HGW-Chloroflexi-6]|nr:MAG: hypothetical protein CVU44_01235 [Chloroflexi bacterium HGW-Chloroflexi-6]
MKKIPFVVILLLTLLSACAPQASADVIPTATETFASTATSIPTEMPQPTATVIPTFTPAVQARLAQTILGPEADSFPAGVNPLTGRAVSDPSLLGIPAMLISISNSPVTARPQAGPGFADWVFELFIGTGTTRFLGVFYGEYPRPVPNTSGGCAVRNEILNPQGAWVGNRVWLDENGNNRQDDWEQGLGGVCVSLLDPATGSPLVETATDSNGYFALEIPQGVESVQLHFQKADDFEFVIPNLGDEDTDSDADPLTGLSEAFSPEPDSRFWDAGLTLKAPPAADEGRVQPIRSGRLTYATLNEMFPFSCLAFAGAGKGIFEQLDACRVVYGTDSDDVNDGVLTVSEMRELAEGNLSYSPINYSGHLFDPLAPDGQKADALQVYYHPFNQAEWRYDPLSGTYLRWTDFQDGSGKLTPALDALTGRQLAFENVIVIYATHDIFRHLQYDINIRPGQEGYAFAFRDGQMYKIRWSTANRAWERQSGLLRPLHFIWPDKTEFPLKPGRTFIHIMTEFSSVSELQPGEWQAYFVTPNDPAPQP